MPISVVVLVPFIRGDEIRQDEQGKFVNRELQSVSRGDCEHRLFQYLGSDGWNCRQDLEIYVARMPRFIRR
jgi:hypothetical protein